MSTNTANVGELLVQLQARADNAYCNYIGLCRKDECLGWEAKVDKGLFGADELKAHKDAAELLGRHRALQEVVNLLHKLNKKDTELAFPTIPGYLSYDEATAELTRLVVLVKNQDQNTNYSMYSFLARLRSIDAMISLIRQYHENLIVDLSYVKLQQKLPPEEV